VAGVAEATGQGGGGSQLCALELRHNALGDVGAAALADALATNPCLTWLDLSSNAVGERGGVAVARALHVNSVLWRIDLGDNPLGPGAVKSLLDVPLCGSGSALELIGLDRVPASVKTREAVRLA
ncbi:unnamed protein product, partial [Discosporangium mesarthrocarpum]